MYFFNTENVFRYLYCSKANSLRCRARANFVVGEQPRKFLMTYCHNHPKDLIQKGILDFMKQLKLACEGGLNMTLIEIYDNVAKMWEVKIMIYIFFVICRFPDEARLKPFSSVESTMEKWKSASRWNVVFCSRF